MKALDYSCQCESGVRTGSLWSLGRMNLQNDSYVLEAVVSRLNDAIENPVGGRDQEIALEAALNLVDGADEEGITSIEDLLLRACKNSTSSMRHVIARELLLHRQRYTAPMISASISAIQIADSDVPKTIEIIDMILYSWDIDGDRKRVLSILACLLSHNERAVGLEALPRFREKLSKEPGAVLGWYAVSLLLTGNPRLCLAADRMLPSEEAPGDLDIDLSEFGLDARWVLFLARKIIGYCLGSKPGAGALLLSCLRASEDGIRPELEALVTQFFLINYPDAIGLLNARLSRTDAARKSVRRLSRAIDRYFDDLRSTGSCVTLRPSERERGLQHGRRTDQLMDAMERAKEQSELYRLVPVSTLLYGSGVIYYVDPGDGDPPRRQETSLASFQHEIEIPRLEVLDPVGLHSAMTGFRLESAPS